jgi:hypothetical protein
MLKQLRSRVQCASDAALAQQNRRHGGITAGCRRVAAAARRAVPLTCAISTNAHVRYAGKCCRPDGCDVNIKDAAVTEGASSSNVVSWVNPGAVLEKTSATLTSNRRSQGVLLLGSTANLLCNDNHCYCSCCCWSEIHQR